MPVEPVAPVAHASETPKSKIHWIWHVMVSVMLAVMVWITYSNSFQSLWTLDNKYIIQLDPLTLADFRDACVYYETAPASYFVQGRICSRATEGGRISLTDDKLIVTRNGHREETSLAGEHVFVHALHEHFGIRMPVTIQQ